MNINNTEINKILNHVDDKINDFNNKIKSLENFVIGKYSETDISCICLEGGFISESDVLLMEEEKVNKLYISYL